jgi:hypothetical protein
MGMPYGGRNGKYVCFLFAEENIVQRLNILVISKTFRTDVKSMKRIINRCSVRLKETVSKFLCTFSTQKQPVSEQHTGTRTLFHSKDNFHHFHHEIHSCHPVYSRSCQLPSA